MVPVLSNSDFGDPIWWQHLVWLMSRPAFWLVLLKSALIIVGVFMIARRLMAAKRWLWLALFLLAVAAYYWWLRELSAEAAQLIGEGRGNEVVLLRIVGWVTNLLAVLVVVALFRRKRPRPT